MKALSTSTVHVLPASKKLLTTLVIPFIWVNVPIPIKPTQTPKKANILASHIQNRAPGPSAIIAMATPTIFPIPIVAESAVQSTAKLEASPPLPSFSFTSKFLTAWGNFVI